MIRSSLYIYICSIYESYCMCAGALITEFGLFHYIFDFINVLVRWAEPNLFLYFFFFLEWFDISGGHMHARHIGARSRMHAFLLYPMWPHVFVASTVINQNDNQNIFKDHLGWQIFINFYLNFKSYASHRVYAVPRRIRFYYKWMVCILYPFV